MSRDVKGTYKAQSSRKEEVKGTYKAQSAAASRRKTSDADTGAGTHGHRRPTTRMVPVPSESIVPERDVDKSPILECRHLGIDFGGLRAVDDFNLMIGRTEIAGLIGPNGAGKTTVFNLLTKVYAPTRGTIMLDGVDTAGMDTPKVSQAGIARTFQNIRLFDSLTVEDNVRIGLHNQIKCGMWSGMLRLPRHWVSEKEFHDRSLELLDVFHMADNANDIAGSLPYGAQRRLEIVRALATNPKLLLLDEPAAGMNPSETSELMDNIVRIRDMFNIAILLIGYLRGHCGAQLRQDNRQGDPARHTKQPAGHRGISWQTGRGGVSGMAMLKISDLNVYYGSIHAVKGISFEVEEGEIVTLIGANGAGKSTTLNTVAGLLRPRSGSIEFEGESLVGVPTHKMVSKGIALCPEGRRIFQDMTVRENLEMGAFTRSEEESLEMRKRVYESFPRLKERRTQAGGTLSGGEQQMLAMGRALMSKPKLMMLDEPSMGLAPILVQEIFAIIKELNEKGTTILLVEQNASMALSIANRAYVLETGRISMSGDANDLLHDERVRQAYLGG